MNKLLDECIAEKYPAENLNKIVEFSEAHAATNPKESLKQITKKLFSGAPLISLRAATKLEPHVKNKLCAIFKRLSDEFRGNASCELMLEIYPWIKTNFPQVHQNIVDEDKLVKSKLTREKDKADEEKQLAKAINLSLQDAKSKTASPQHDLKTANSAKGAYTDASNMLKNSTPEVSTSNPNKKIVKVRALYDFEAAEDNELSFKAGELIVLLDDSDENWWQGSNHRGDGLFPAQFVTKDVGTSNDEQEAKMNKKSEPSAIINQRTIEPNKIERCWQLLSNVDPSTTADQDTKEMLDLEEQCSQMIPLVDTEIQKTDKVLDEMQDLETKLAESLKQFNEIMKVSSAGQSVPMMPHQPIPTYMNPMNTVMSDGQQMYAPPNFVGNSQYPQMNVPMQGNYAMYPSDPNQYQYYAGQSYPSQMNGQVPTTMVPPGHYPTPMRWPQTNGENQQPPMMKYEHVPSQPTNQK